MEEKLGVQLKIFRLREVGDFLIEYHCLDEP